MKKEELLRRAEERVKNGEWIIKHAPSSNIKEWEKELEFSKQVVTLIRETEKAKLIWDATCPGVDAGWLPTAENINALPKPLFHYIAGLETNADPPSMVAENIILRDTVKALEIKLEEVVKK